MDTIKAKSIMLFFPPLDFLRTQTPVMMWMMATRIPSRATHSSTTTGRALPGKSFPLSSFVLPRSHHNSGVCWNTSDIFKLLIHSALAVTLAVWYQPVAHIKKSTLAQLIEGHCLWGLFCPRFFSPLVLLYLMLPTHCKWAIICSMCLVSCELCGWFDRLGPGFLIAMTGQLYTQGCVEQTYTVCVKKSEPLQTELVFADHRSGVLASIDWIKFISINETDQMSWLQRAAAHLPSLPPPVSLMTLISYLL